MASFAEVFGERGPWFFLTPDKEQAKKQKRAERLLATALKKHFHRIVKGKEKAAERRLKRALAEAMNGEESQ